MSKNESNKNYYRENSLHQYLQKIIDTSGERLITSSINTGFSNIEEELYGLRLGDLYVVGGAPAMGLNTFIGQLALQVSNHSGVLYLPQVESPDKLSKRLLCIAGDIRMHRFEHEKWDQKLAQKVNEGIDSLMKRTFFIEKMCSLREEEFLKIIEDYVIQNEVKLVIIDDEETMFQNLKGSFTSIEKYYFVLKLKLLFHRLNCCGIIVKKINSAERTQINPYQLPKIKDIQQEYDLANLSEHVWLLHRLDYYGIKKDRANNTTKNRIDLYCIDADFGVMNNLYYRFNKLHTSFEVMVDLR